MSLSYDGIGASLQLEDDYVTVINVIAGGPAQIDGQLKPQDRITAVGQGELGEFVDVIGWRLDDVVDLIRGPGGSLVRLQILPAGAAPGTPESILPLIRDSVKLEEQAAKSNVIEVPRGDDIYRIGVIDVPSIYQDYAARSRGDENYTSTTRDVERLVTELTAEGIDGLVMDLRQNGGGHLSEATELSGLFIDRGPVVQLRETRGNIQVLDDPSPDLVYDGPWRCSWIDIVRAPQKYLRPPFKTTSVASLLVNRPSVRAQFRTSSTLIVSYAAQDTGSSP